MNAGQRITVHTDTLIALTTHLRVAGSQLSASDLASQAIRTWLADHAGPFADGTAVSSATGAAACGARGYQWKELFLPEGAELRMHYNTEIHHARVSGDMILHQGRSVSPRQLTIAVAGDGRNAWRDLALRLPGEKHFRPACLLRRNLQAQLKRQLEAGSDPATGSPVATIAAAAAAMSETLRTALALVEHSNAQAIPKYERRVASHRRALDVLADHTTFD